MRAEPSDDTGRPGEPSFVHWDHATFTAEAAAVSLISRQVEV